MSRRRAVSTAGTTTHALHDCNIGQVVGGDVIVQHLTINLVGGGRKTMALLATLAAAVNSRAPALPHQGQRAGG